MVDYWETRRGLKKGEVANPSERLYANYLRWHQSNCEGKPANNVEFNKYFTDRGYVKKSILRRLCWMLNKAIVPVSWKDRKLS